MDNYMEDCLSMLDAIYRNTIENGKKFKFDDGSVGKTEEASIKSFNKVRNYIEKKLDADSSKELLDLLKKSNFKQMEYFETENEMYFKEGFACAINLITGCTKAK